MHVADFVADDEFTVATIRDSRRITPDHTDPKTVLHFAQLSYNSYYEPDDPKWIDVPGTVKLTQVGMSLRDLVNWESEDMYFTMLIPTY